MMESLGDDSTIKKQQQSSSFSKPSSESVNNTNNDVKNKVKSKTNSDEGSSKLSDGDDIIKQMLGIILNNENENEKQSSLASSTSTTTIQPPLIIKQQSQSQQQLLPPKIPSKCPLFCCFYAEFDIKVGPKIFFQCPPKFMDQQIDISISKIHDILDNTFSKQQQNRKQKQQPPEKIDNINNNNNTQNEDDGNDGKDNATNNNKTQNDNDYDVKNATTRRNSSITTTNSDNTNTTVETKSSTTAATSGVETDGGSGNDQNHHHHQEEARKMTTAASGSSSNLSSIMNGDNNRTSNNVASANDDDDDDDDNKNDNNPSSSSSGAELSIFDSTSEYIITGNELTGKIVTLSTHNMHVMTRPTLICDERYERNSLLFSVGIVLRRGADPRPFRPLISQLALTLRSMEIESQFLSSQKTRNTQIQPLLERILLSLNSSQWECNLLVSPSNTLNLKLFHPPKPEASLVYDHQVPILLRKDLQLQMYDWDLAINWVILHIDGATNARQISIKAEVDLEMVRACLRVLKHHGVIDLVDMFLYSNRYEFTDKATSMLAGKESRIIQDAVDFVMKRQPSFNNTTTTTTAASASPTFGIGVGGGAQHGGGGGGTSNDWSHNNTNTNTNHISSSSQSSSYPPKTMSLFGGGSHKSSNFRFAMMAAAQSIERESSMMRREDQRKSKAALAELYCACNRSVSFGDLWVSLSAKLPTSLSLPDLQQQQQQKKYGNVLGRKNSNESDPEQQQVRDPLDSLGLSPMETFHIESLRRSHREDQHQQKSTTIDWNDFFTRFDHRRFCSFGQVYGLLRRVHDYPYFPGTFPDLETSLQNNPSATNTNNINTVDGSSVSKQTTLKDEFVEEKHYALAKNIASKMDGTRCDDELVCLFAKPYNQLVDLVEKFGKKKILSIYATTSGS